MTDKPRKLTVKQKRFVKEYVKNDGNGTRAALATYNTTDLDTARAIGSENLAKPSIKEAIEQALIKHEITMDAAVKPIADGLHATREIMTTKGTISQADHSVRLKASGMALKLMGAEKQEGGNTFNFNFKGNANFNVEKYKE